MIYDARVVGRVRNSVLLISAVTWTLLLIKPMGFDLLAHCQAISSRTAQPSLSFRTLLAMNPPALLAADWAVMLIAMMSPVLIQPLCHVYLRSFRRRRGRSVVLCIAGYALIWILLGCALLSMAAVVHWFSPRSYFPAAAALLVALVWQFSPVKQRCLNRCHAHPALAAFGAAADFAALRFGITHGIWCGGSCWAVMLFTILLPQGHIFAMAAATALTLGERLELPRPPSWCCRGAGKAIRIMVAQARIRLLA